jgi:hypothetical protein
VKINPGLCINCPLIASGPDEWPFGLHPEHVRHGWPWRTAHMRRVGDMGCKRHILWMPLGRETGVRSLPFDMASRLLAAPPEYRALVNGFAPAMLPLIREGHTIDVYLGMLQIPTMAELHSARGRYDDYLRRLSTNLKPFTDIGARMYWDSSCLIAPGMVEHGHLKAMEMVAGPAGIESWPLFADHWAGHPLYIVDSDYRIQIDMPGALPREKAGPVVRTINHLMQDKDALLRAYAEILADGHTPGLDLNNLPAEL